MRFVALQHTASELVIIEDARTFKETPNALFAGKADKSQLNSVVASSRISVKPSQGLSFALLTDRLCLTPWFKVIERSGNKRQVLAAAHDVERGVDELQLVCKGDVPDEL